MKRRSSGILLHVTSLPSPYGIGDLGPGAYRFADFLAETRQRHWQVLPLNPTSQAHGNSPYDSYSAFAGNPLLISPELLVREGFLRQDELEECPSSSKESVEYKLVTQQKVRLMDKAYERWRDRLAADKQYGTFCQRNAEWLEDHSLFMALKTHFRGAVWRDWPSELREREAGAISEWKKRCQKQVQKECFLQYLFFKQWSALKKYCNSQNILIMGDLPIYANYDSADVWAHQEIFKLNTEKRPSVVAGVPPDYFSATGQLWGTPVYRWDVLKSTKYAWWVKRIKHNLACFDKLRLDHFRGFVACWEVPANETTAIRGQWVKAPAEDFFAMLMAELPELPIFAEDLGFITPDVHQVMNRFAFPGMKVLLFAFENDLPTHPYAPHNYGNNFVVYTGTHDTNTVKGWFKSEASRDQHKRLFAYVGRELTDEQVHWELIRLAVASVADTAIIPMQDLLGLDADARMNRPGTTEGNWKWRLTLEQLTPSLVTKLAEVTQLYGRATA